MIKKTEFGTAKNGKPVTGYLLENRNGMRIRLLDLGATLAEVWVPDRYGVSGNVVLGYATPAEYEENDGYIGAVVGRVANRIGGASFMLSGKTYRLAANDGENSLHGGTDSYSARIWDAYPDELRNRVTFRLFSPDGDQHYPGNLWIQVTYTLTDAGEIRIRYRAKTDQNTLVNLTNHSYFNLSGHLGSATILDHMVWLNSDRITPVADAASIPTGEYRDVTGTPMDFRMPKTVGRDIGQEYDQLIYGSGYDHNWMLNRGDCQAILYHPATGRRMTVTTDLPAVQMYSGNYLAGIVRRYENGRLVCGKGRDLTGQEIERRSGICFETQVPPDAVHHDNFPTCILLAGHEWESETVYRFDTAGEEFWKE